MPVGGSFCSIDLLGVGIERFPVKERFEVCGKGGSFWLALVRDIEVLRILVKGSSAAAPARRGDCDLPLRDFLPDLRLLK